MAWLSDKKEQVIINQLLGMLNNNSLRNRNQAAREFVKLGEVGAQSLVSALESPEPRQRELARRILIRLDTKATSALSASMQTAPVPIQKEIILILGQMKNNKALENLFEILKGENYKLRILAAEALAENGDSQAIPHLLVALGDSDPDVRIAAVVALGTFRDPETYINIADLLDDVEINVRIATAKTFEKIHATSTVPYLVEALYDSFWWLGREDAILILLSAIASFGRAAIDNLIEAMSAKDPTVRRYAISLLCPLREPRIMGALEIAFYDTNYDVAESALEALLEFGKGALPILTEALVSPNDWIREKAVWGLGEIGGEQAVVYLLEMLEDKTDTVRKATIQSLTKLKDPRALPTLRAISSKRENREIAKLARQAIAEIEAP